MLRAIKTWMRSRNLVGAVSQGDAARVTRLLQLDPTLVEARFKKNRLSALHLAVLGGHTQVVEVLLANGADANARDRHGSMPLLDAAVLASRDTVALLIAHDARVNAADNDGATPLTAAVAGAEWRDDLGVVEFLLDRGADANARDNAGRSALSQVRSRLREVHGVPFLAANGERLMMLADLLQQHGAEG